MYRFPALYAFPCVTSGHAFAAQSEEGINNRGAMHQMVVVLKHHMTMMNSEMAAMRKMQMKLESREAGGSISKRN